MSCLGHVRLPLNATERGSSFSRFLYHKRHRGDDATLFVANVPSDFSADDLREVYAPFGAVVEVQTGTFGAAKASFAHLKFDSSDAVEAIVASSHASGVTGSKLAGPGERGLLQWIADAEARPDRQTLLEDADQFIDDFEAAEEEVRCRRQNPRTEDQHGDGEWTQTVTSASALLTRATDMGARLRNACVRCIAVVLSYHTDRHTHTHTLVPCGP